jgi:predicted enzyme related to lactoylglutathione lyase
MPAFASEAARTSRLRPASIDHHAAIVPRLMSQFPQRRGLLLCAMKLASTRLVTHDVCALARFYSTVIGIVPVGIEDYVEFETATGVLAISSKRGVDIFNAGAAVPAANRSVIVEFEVENVDRERSRLDRIIGEFVLEPTDQPWGSRSMLFRDPDGNLINFFSQTAAGTCNGIARNRRKDSGA